MAKYKSSKPSQHSGGYKVASCGTFKDRNLAGMSPDKAQSSLQPTAANPVRMQKRMAGAD